MDFEQLALLWVHELRLTRRRKEGRFDLRSGPGFTGIFDQHGVEARFQHKPVLVVDKLSRQIDAKAIVQDQELVVLFAESD